MHRRTTATLLAMVIAATAGPGSVVMAQDATSAPAPASGPVLGDRAEALLSQARTVTTIVARMGRPMHSGELEAAEGEGPDAAFHRLEGAVTDIEDAARSLRFVDGPDEARRLLVDDLHPDVQAFAGQVFGLRDLMSAEDPEKPVVRSIIGALDDLDLAVADLEDSIGEAAAAVQEEQLLSRRGLRGPLNPKLLPSGNVLVALALEDRVVELSPDGDIVWEHAITYPTDVERLEDGNTLIASRDGGVVEIDAGGNEVWSFAGQGVYGVDQLADGDRLITEQGGEMPRIVEVDLAGNVVWQYTGGSAGLVAPSATRLENGDTLVVDNSGYGAGTASVVEVTPAGEVVWTFDDGIWGVYGVTRLANGNTLINDQGNGRIIEVTPEGEVVWRFGALDTPGGLDVAPDGRMVIGVFGENRLFEIVREAPSA
jgi:hypothetical protein